MRSALVFGFTCILFSLLLGQKNYQSAAKHGQLSSSPANPSASDSVQEAWVARYHNLTGDFARALALDSTGNVYVTGVSPDSGVGTDYTTIKYDANGNQKWVVRYNGPGNHTDHTTDLAVDAEGNVYVTGYSHGIVSNFDYATIKYNADGNQLWIQRYNGPGNGMDQANALALDDQGNVCVTGVSVGSGTGGEYTTIKYDRDGNEIWVARYHGPLGSGNAQALTVDAKGNVYVTGFSADIGIGNDFATVKYDSIGNELWAARYNGPGNSTDVASGLGVDAQGNVYVAGRSMGANTDFDFATVKYTEILNDVVATPPGVPRHNQLHQNYPNPFNPSTNIRFNVGVNGRVSIKIYNLLGQLLAELVDKNLTPGQYNYQWDASDFASGVYLYRLEIKSSQSKVTFIQTKKLMLIK